MLKIKNEQSPLNNTFIFRSTEVRKNKEHILKWLLPNKLLIISNIPSTENLKLRIFGKKHTMEVPHCSVLALLSVTSAYDSVNPQSTRQVTTSDAFLRASQVALVQRTHLPEQEAQETLGSIPASGRPREGNGNPLQCSCLENPMHRGAWRATYSSWGHRESDTSLSDWAHMLP